MSCSGAAALPAPRSCFDSSTFMPVRAATACRIPPTPPTSTPSRPVSSRRSRATGPSNDESRASSAGTRCRWSCGRTSSGRHRRPHLDVRVRGNAVRDRLQPFLPRATGKGYDGDVIYFQGHASPGIYSRAFLEGRLERLAPREFPSRAAAGRRPLVVPAPVADARLLGVPDGVDGPRAHHVDLPGPLHALPGRSRPGADRRTARSGRFWATARPTSPRHSARFRSPRAKSSTT